MLDTLISGLQIVLTPSTFILIFAGTVVGVIFGALSYTTINFIIVSIPGLSVDIQDTFQGLVLIVVILIQTVGPVIKENLQRAKKRRMASAGKS